MKIRMIFWYFKVSNSYYTSNPYYESIIKNWNQHFLSYIIPNLYKNFLSYRRYGVESSIVTDLRGVSCTPKIKSIHLIALSFEVSKRRCQNGRIHSEPILLLESIRDSQNRLCFHALSMTLYRIHASWGNTYILKWGMKRNEKANRDCISDHFSRMRQSAGYRGNDSVGRI